MSYEPRTCAHCGETYSSPPGYRGSAAVWSQRLYCSDRCRSNAKNARTICERACAMCGVPFVVRYKNADQRTCSRKCGQAWAKAKGRQQRTRTVLIKRDGVRQWFAVCECGEPATTTVHFYSLASSGYLIAQTLPVCPSCRDYMLETDGGCSATPLPYQADRSPCWGPLRGGEYVHQAAESI